MLFPFLVIRLFFHLPPPFVLFKWAYEALNNHILYSSGSSFIVMLAFYDENFKIDENSAWQNHSPLDFSFALILFAYLMPFHASHKYNKWFSIECKFKWMIARSRYRWLDSCSLQSHAVCLFAFIILSRIRENV